MEIRGIELNTAVAKELSKLSSDGGGYPLQLRLSPFRRRLTNIYVADWKLGEGLLADDADWDAPTWSMRSEELPRLEATLRALCEALPDGFEFVASWVSEPLDRKVELSCDELLGLARTSSFNGHTVYVIKPAARR